MKLEALDRRPLFWVALLIGWTIPALFSAGIVLEHRFEIGEPIPVWEAFLTNAPFWYSWALLTPLVLRFERRFPVTGDSVGRTIGIHLALACGFAIVHATLSAFGMRFTAWGYGDRALSEAIASAIRYGLEYDVLLYAALVGLGSALDSYRGYRASEVRQADLVGRLAEARLLTLRGRLQPRLLFHSLAAIDERMSSDVPEARRLVARLATLLRRNLEDGRARRVTLAEELVHLDLYLDIERAIQPGSLTLEIEVDDDALEALVPSLLLQPLAENLLHERQNGEKRIALEARKEEDRLRIEIGVGHRNDHERLQEGSEIGLVRSRLGTLYEGTAMLRRLSTSGGARGWKMIVPYSRASAVDLARHPPVASAAVEPEPGQRENARA